MAEKNVFRGEQTRGEIIRAAHKLFVRRVENVKPTLEDVFLVLAVGER